MSVTLLIGKTGSGKTEQVYNEIIQSAEAQETKLLIVPEQATLDAQQALVERHPRHCISGVEVLSFQRLAYRVSDHLGIAGKTLMTDVGKNMLIRQIIETHSETFPFLKRYVHKKGYINELQSLLTEFSRYTLEDRSFEEVEAAMDQSVLKIKMVDLRKLYGYYKEALNTSYLSGETLMDRLVATCHNNSFIQGAHIVIDGFYGFTPIQYSLIKKLSDTALSVTITLTIDPRILKGQPLDESHLYYESRNTYDTLFSILGEDPSKEIETLIKTEIAESEVKAALRDNLYQYPYKPFNGPVDGVRVVRCNSASQEMDYVRDTILKLVRENHYRYKDITILTGDVGMYRQLIQEKFDQAHVPYYMDQKKQVTANEGIAFVLSLVRLYTRRLDYHTMFECLKSGWMTLDEQDIDYLENYVIRYGIRGWKKWQKEWVYKSPDIHKQAEDPMAVDHLAKLNALRVRIITPLAAHQISGKAPIQAYIHALYELILHYDLEKRLQEKSDVFMDQGLFEKAREYKQIYRIIIDLLDQLNELNDGTSMDFGQFYDVLEAGFETLELAVIPANVDQVMVGDLTRSRIRQRQACFVIGVNEGVIPSLNEGSGLITDDEREQLKKLGMTLAPTAKTGLFRDQFYIYMALQRFQDKLYLSYTTTDEEGKASRPSHLLNIIRKILTGIKVDEADALYKERSFISTPAVTYHTYIKQRQRGGEVDDVVGQWLKDHSPWSEKLKDALQGEKESLRPVKLSSNSTRDLYGYKLSNSVSRLEQFSSCPFRHFVTYGLKANLRESYEITMPHLGMIFHRVIELFSKRLIHRDMDWGDITETIRLKWIDELVEEVLGEAIYEVFFDNNRNRHRILRLKKMLDRALWTISYQVTQGDFKPQDAEWRFDGNDHPLKAVNIDLANHRKMSLRGTIDRVDHHRIGGLDYITVVDYKSSTHDIDVNKLFAGLQLQLVVYLNAACEIKAGSLGRVVPAGIFYFKIDDPFVTSKEKVKMADRDHQVLDMLRLKGLVVEDEGVIAALDRNFSRKSSVIPVTRNKDGALGKASKTIPLEDLERLQRFTQLKLKELGDAIIDGDITARPSKEQTRTACDYCDYKSICQFDEKLPGYDYREIEEADQATVLEKIKMMTDD